MADDQDPDNYTRTVKVSTKPNRSMSERFGNVGKKAWGYLVANDADEAKKKKRLVA